MEQSSEVLSGIGLDGLAIEWLSWSKSAIHVIGVLNGVWSRIGFGCIFFLAAMSSMDSQLYDAAKIDGARWGRTSLSVTVPSIRFAVEFSLMALFPLYFSFSIGFKTPAEFLENRIGLPAEWTGEHSNYVVDRVRLPHYLRNNAVVIPLALITRLAICSTARPTAAAARSRRARVR
ncbi:MAG: ABC transporter permease subunit [bacterium]